MIQGQVNYSQRRECIINRIILIILGTAFLGCEYNNRDEMFPELSYDCSQLTEYYSENIQPIIESNCIGCHQNPSPAGNVSFDSYESVAINIKYGSILERIQREVNENGFMPKYGYPLSQGDILKITTFRDMSCP